MKAAVSDVSIRDHVRQFVVQNFLFGQGELADDASFLETGIIDSTGVLELVGFIESTFAIAVQDHDLVPANLDSVLSVARFVERKLTAQESPLAG
jgi:acyl carrier protein